MSNATLTAPLDLLSHTLEHCQECLNRSDFPGATRALNRAVNLSPGNPEILVHRGSLLLFLKNPEAARADFSAALKLDSNCSAAHSGLARYHFDKGALAEAQACASRALALDPSDNEAAKVMLSLPAHQRRSQPVANKRFSFTEMPEAAPKAGASNPARKNVWKFLTAGCEFFADAKPPLLTRQHLKNSRVLPRRKDILALMPKGGICAEIGTQTGNFAKQILSVMKPAKLHIYDIDYAAFDHAYFKSNLEKKTVELHRGDSSTQLAAMPDGSFDFIYVDGDHSYEGAVRDLEQAARKIKPDGWIVCNDYTIFSPLEKSKYGVYRAVNEFCLKHGYEIAYLALHQWSYHDVALRKMQPADAAVSSANFKPARRRTARAAAATVSAIAKPAEHNLGTTEAVDVIQTIGQGDEMFTGDKAHYFGVGKSALHCIESAMRAANKPSSSVQNILDLPCGHGRVMRYFKAAFPGAQITACDLNKPAVDFCAKTFAAQPVYSNVDVNQIPIHGKFDLIWSGSLLTHLRPEACAEFIRLWNTLINPGGIIAFTLHGRWVERSLATGRYKYGLKDADVVAMLKEYYATGFGYADYPGVSGYGISVSSPAFVFSQLIALPDLKLISYHEKGWDNHQDFVCLQKQTPAEPLG